MTTPKQLHDDISAGKFKPAYYFFGAEDYRIVEAEKFLARRFLGSDQPGGNFRKLDARRTAAADVVNELAALSLLGDKRVVAVSSIQSYRPTDLERVLSAVKLPDPTRLVILTSPSSVLASGRGAFTKKASFKAISDAATVVEFDRLTPEEIRGLVVRGIKKAGLEIDRDALDLLTELIGGSKGGLDAELAKLMDYKEPGQTVTVEDVRDLTAGYEVYNVFELADHIVEGSVDRVMRMTHKLLADGNSPVGLTAILQSHFLSLYLVKNGKAPLGRRNWPSLVQRFRRQASRYSNAQLERVIRDIAATDAGFRSPEMKPEMALEMLVLSLTAHK